MPKTWPEEIGLVKERLLVLPNPWDIERQSRG